MSDEKRIRYIEFINREKGKSHHTHEEDAKLYEIMKTGDSKTAAKTARKIFSSNLPSLVSDDPLRNYKYLFVASATLASRAAISVGIETERAYNVSNSYIFKMDKLATVEEVVDLYAEMIGFFAAEINKLDTKKTHSRTVTKSTKKTYSRSVMKCMDYIYNHLHEPLPVPELAEIVGIDVKYLSEVFKEEVGVSISKYVLSKRIETAKNMLVFSDLSLSEIASILSFSSLSHFVNVFKKHYGVTPRKYRNSVLS